MRLRWYIAAASVGIVAATAAALLPLAPRWSKRLRADAWPLSFSSDGKTLYLIDGLRQHGDPPYELRLFRLDAETGKELGRTVIPRPTTEAYSNTTVSPDGATLFVAIKDRPPGKMASGVFHNFHAFDTSTGKVRWKPIEYVQWMHGPASSPDGRWFWAYADTGIGVYSAATGKRILHVPIDSGQWSKEAVFSPDGSKIAIHGAEDAMAIVRIFSLPEGKFLRRIVMPDRYWSLRDWIGRQLYVDYAVILPDKRYYRREGRSIDVNSETPSWAAEFHTEPMQSGIEGNATFQYGSNWVARMTFGSRKPTRIEQIRAWIGAQIGNNYSPPPGLTVAIRFLNPGNGAVVSDAPIPIPSPAVISSDGKQIASVVQNDGLIEVWDSDFATPWVSAGVSAVVAAGVVLLAGLVVRRLGIPKRAKSSAREPNALKPANAGTPTGSTA
jgi:hypothetical protein